MPITSFLLWNRFPKTAVAGLLVVAGAWASATIPVTARGTQATPADPTRFEAEIEAFRSWDRRNAVPADAVLFVGSSSIRLWPTAVSFPGLPVVNRGFGGSQISDVNHYIDDVALKYRAAVIVFYAGDNDINAGETPEQVFDDYRTFVDRVHAARVDTRIIFIPAKPSLARWELWPVMRDMNERVRTYSESSEYLYYADIATPMLGPDGTPTPRLFVDDGLHLSEAGYEVWTGTVRPVVDKARAQ